MVFRILSLDGGGVWALIQARALIDLYSATTTGHQVLADFDLATANSGGSIVLGGLVEDLPLSQILALFEDPGQRSSIFQPTTRILDSIANETLHIGPKYSAKAKLVGLERLMPSRGGQPVSTAAAGVRRAGSANDVHLLITSFDFDRNIARFFRSAAAGGAAWGTGNATDDVTLAEAIHASTNAPVNYFDEPANLPAGRFWDGAISGCNNPVLAGVAEAIMLGQQPNNIVALSIGTATTCLAGPPVDNPPDKFTQARSPQSVIDDLGKLAGCITDDPPDIASFLAHLMTASGAGLAPVNPQPVRNPGDPRPALPDSRVVRMNPMISPIIDPATGARTAPGGWSANQFDYLANDIHLDALESSQVQYISDYTALWIAGGAPNQPMRMDSNTLQAELGYTTYGEAKSAWQVVQ